MTNNITIAIDGYSSCGKSTIAKGIARELGYLFIDSGAMYRAVTLFCIQNNIITATSFNVDKVIKNMEKINLEFKKNSALNLFEIYLNDVNVEKEIRSMEVAGHVSRISAIKEVRRKMVALQQELGKKKGIVMDGRDIGTNVFPDAELKLFMTADENIRILRRWKELTDKGIQVTMEDVKKNLQERDYEDTHREHNPLRKSDDAIVLDNTALSIEEQLTYVLQLARKRIAS